MDTKYDFHDGEQNTVYIRRVAMENLPDDVREQAPDVDGLYAVHGMDGERLALVKDRKLAFFLARQNDLSPVSVH
ncbi:DUF1150 family protein [Paracoccus tegillarcae]|uniref:DUF1150 domain-containing protein n=1 Tax=Paracoccus tegillarcae TaxID=1529068 RepID=A0A2K9ETH9_9RHOB|nr:DUF1150 family protein [Paracoccus tegillarcae]AUH32007.1 DUF1150 domain-containing protein [Paracoccus tegillarcae]AUH35075.1 DUF1150 domain-containing protein [Paracoccus tegillarcae]